MGIVEIKAYAIFKSRFGEKEADTLMEYFRNLCKGRVQFGTANTESHKLEYGLKDDIKRLEIKISETKNDLVKWLFGFWITIILLLAANFFLGK